MLGGAIMFNIDTSVEKSMTNALVGVAIFPVVVSTERMTKLSL